MKKIALIAFSVVYLSCNMSTQKPPAEHVMTEAELQAKYLLDAKATYTYKNAWMDVEKLKINVDLADKKNIDSDNVVDQFNNTVGQTMGRVDNLSEVKMKMKKAGDYLKVVQLKEAANLALNDAADNNAKLK